MALHLMKGDGMRDLSPSEVAQLAPIQGGTQQQHTGQALRKRALDI